MSASEELDTASILTLINHPIFRSYYNASSINKYKEVASIDSLGDDDFDRFELHQDSCYQGISTQACDSAAIMMGYIDHQDLVSAYAQAVSAYDSLLNSVSYIVNLTLTQAQVESLIDWGVLWSFDFQIDQGMDLGGGIASDFGITASGFGSPPSTADPYGCVGDCKSRIDSKISTAAFNATVETQLRPESQADRDAWCKWGQEVNKCRKSCGKRERSGLVKKCS